MLSLTLIGVSVVTAAVLPLNKKLKINKVNQWGSLTASTDNIPPFTCTPTANIEPSNSCNDTVVPPSGTTGIGVGSISNGTTIGD